MMKRYKIEAILDNEGEWVKYSDHSQKLKEVLEKTFNAGFDEGYTNPLERDGRIITTEEYERERRKNYLEWIKLKDNE